jgi:hypothetical protein
VLPSFAEALADGRVCAEHVDTLGRAMLGLSDAKQTELVSFEAALVRAAESSTPDEWNRRVRWFVDDLDTAHTRNELERAHKLTKLRVWQEKGSGMVQLSGSIEPVAGERLWNALRREINRLLDTNRQLPAADRLTDEQAAAQALVNLVAGGHAAQAGANATDLIVLVGLERLTGESGGQQVCETSRGTRLPVDWVRRLAHDARIIPLVVDDAGLTVELDRAARRRLAGFTQRVMLRAMHDTCMIDDCDIPFDDCEIHHLVAYNGRNTRIGNMGPLCKKHHHDIHDRGWNITLDDQRNLTITLPDGTIWAYQKYRPPGKEPPGPPPPQHCSGDQASPLQPTARRDLDRPDNGSPADETRGAVPHAPDDRPDATAA